MRVLTLTLCAFLLAACGSDNPDDIAAGTTSISSDNAKMAIGVNSFLWRATLDTISFMPMASADPFGGVVITDWYSAQQKSDERMKVTVYILDRRLRADGVRVAVFRQTRNADGSWTDAQVNPDTATKLEDAILTRARELRLASGEKS